MDISSLPHHIYSQRLYYASNKEPVQETLKRMHTELILLCGLSNY